MDACQCNIIIAGDFNIDSLKDSREQKEVTELLASYNITRMTLPPTRITANSVTSIDAICTNLETNKVTASNKSKAIWDVINSERKATHETSEVTMTCLKIGEQEVTDATKIANNINSFFSKIAEETLRNQVRHNYSQENLTEIATPLSILHPVEELF
ncbi:hypothetical protein J6590_065971 [Homalodisca vitripennis]|nr:hypothetical protein J6590_065971 [Homalodisca vitripennis]